MNLRSWLAAVLVMFTLGGCVQGATEHGGAPYAPNPPENSGHMDKGVDM
jgi:hypothetical protein